MPEDCPVVAEYDDDVVLTPEAVQAVLGGPVPVPRPVITDELRGDEPPGWLPYRRRRGPSAPVARRGRRASCVEVHGEAPEVMTLDVPAGRQVTVRPGGRARLALPGGPGWCLDVVHTPTLSSGVLTAAGAANFEIRSGEVDLGDASEATVWNDGPGEVTLVIRRRPRRRWGRRADR